MTDPINRDAELRLADPVVRIALAEVDAPGPLHYLLEAEGFQVVGCASDERELARLLKQDLRPDVVVLDADVVAASVLAAREHAASAQVIVIWPDGVQPPTGAERVSPPLVYEELGPTIRRCMDRRAVPVPIIALPMDEPVRPTEEAASVGGAFGRAASRVSVMTATLIAAIVLTMGVSFALGGFRSPPTTELPMSPAAQTSSPAHGEASGAITDPRVVRGLTDLPSVGSSEDHRASPGGQQHDPAPPTNAPVGTGVGQGAPPVAPPVDQGGDPGGPGGDQGNQDGQGDQGGGQGDQGGGQGDQGGGQGDDQGGGQGDDQGGDQGNQDDQGSGDQGDQGGNQDDQGGNQDDQGSNDQGDQGSQFYPHAAQNDDQGNQLGN